MRRNRSLCCCCCRQTLKLWCAWSWITRNAQKCEKFDEILIKSVLGNTESCQLCILIGLWQESVNSEKLTATKCHQITQDNTNSIICKVSELYQQIDWLSIFCVLEFIGWKTWCLWRIFFDHSKQTEISCYKLHQMYMYMYEIRQCSTCKKIYYQKMKIPHISSNFTIVCLWNLKWNKRWKILKALKIAGLIPPPPFPPVCKNISKN